jgi:pimeloyl-ACP methyl ester carboxylesterase
MVFRIGVIGTPLLLLLLGTGCRSVWREPPRTPLLWAVERPERDRRGDDGWGAQASTGDVALELAQDFAASAARAERAGWAEATDDQFQAVCASWAALHELDPTREPYRRAWETYHASLGRLLTNARDEGRFLSGQGMIVSGPSGPMLVPLTVRGSVWRQDDVQAIHPVGEYRARALSRQYRTDGWGVPVVVERREPTGRYAEEQFLTQGTMFAATALLRSCATGGAVLELFDPLHPAIAAPTFAGPMASDLSAPFALRLISSPEIQSDWLSFFGVDVPTRDGLFLLEPYQPGKIPVVLVHGLLSNPAAWVDMANDLRAVPGFSERYQIWGFRYATGDPFLESAGRLRRDLDRAVATIGANHCDPALSQIVLVGHSMGGLVCELQASASEDRLWNAVASRPLAAIVADGATKSALQAMFFFDPQPNVRRVISIATPHEGSTWAMRPIGRLGSLLARPEPDRIVRHAELLRANPGVFSDEISARVPTSVDMLDPDSAVLRAMAFLPTNPCVRFHTVFGYGRTRLAIGEGDGIVGVDSALSPRATSQTGVDASHMTIHRKLESVSEVVRILDEHWQEYSAGPPCHAGGNRR